MIIWNQFCSVFCWCVGLIICSHKWWWIINCGHFICVKRLCVTSCYRGRSIVIVTVIVFSCSSYSRFASFFLRDYTTSSSGDAITTTAILLGMLLWIVVLLLLRRHGERHNNGYNYSSLVCRSMSWCACSSLRAETRSGVKKNAIAIWNVCSSLKFDATFNSVRWATWELIGNVTRVSWWIGQRRTNAALSGVYLNGHAQK